VYLLAIRTEHVYICFIRFCMSYKLHLNVGMQYRFYTLYTGYYPVVAKVRLGIDGWYNSIKRLDTRNGIKKLNYTCKLYFITLFHVLFLSFLVSTQIHNVLKFQVFWLVFE